MPCHGSNVYLQDKGIVSPARLVVRAFLAVPEQSGQELVSTTPEEDSAEVEAAQRGVYGLLVLAVQPIH